tara:strand:+ start:69 stop:590 length:522 start_codon:yes stop_codon:yes gene_type:complete
MADSTTFSFKGGKELQAALRELGDERKIVSAKRHALRKGAEPIIATAKALVPVDEANLRESIKQRAGKKTRMNRGQSREGIDDGDNVVFQIIGIDQNVQPPTDVARKDGSGTYRDPGVAGTGPMNEFGTPDMPANPFMRPAFDSRVGRASVIIRTELGKTIERRAKAAARKAK